MTEREVLEALLTRLQADDKTLKNQAIFLNGQINYLQGMIKEVQKLISEIKDVPQASEVIVQPLQLKSKKSK